MRVNLTDSEFCLLLSAMGLIGTFVALGWWLATLTFTLGAFVVAILRMRTETR